MLALAIASMWGACTSDAGNDGGKSSSTVAGGGADAADASPDTPSGRPDRFHWDFENAAAGSSAPSGTTVPDRSGSGLDGTTGGMVFWVPGQLNDTVAAEARGDANVVLDGARAATVADVTRDESFRLEVGFRTSAHGQDGEGGSGVLVAREASGEAGFRLSVEGGRVRFRVWSQDGAPSEVASSRLVADDRWHRVTAVRDRASSELVVILDGTAVDRAPDASDDLASSAPFTAFRGGKEPRPFLGRIDTVRFVRARIDAPPEAPERAVTQVFKAEAESVPGGGGKTYATFRIPSIVRTSTGTLLAFAEGRVDDACDFGDIDIVMKRSTDGGATWSKLVRVVDPGSNKAGNPIPIAAGSRVVLLATTDPVTCSGTTSCPCDRDGAQSVSVLTSEDDGLTWSAPKDITADVTDPSYRGMLVGPCHGIRLENGPRAGTLVVAAMHSRTGDGKTGGHVLASSDDGDTWTLAATENDSPMNVNESTVAELSDGRLLVNTRHNLSAASVNDQERAKGLRGEARLTPELAYESSPAYARTARFRGPVVQGSLLARQGSERFGDERRVLFSYPSGQHGTSAGQRHDLRAYVSRDDGTTWSPGRRVVGGWAAYSDLVALEGGSVGVLHEAGAEAVSGSSVGSFYRRLDFVRFGVEWLDERTIVSFGFEERAPGDAFGKLAGAGGPPISLTATGDVTLVGGRHHSTAARFDGASRACTSASGAAGWLDFGRNDSFAVEATFRTTAHGSGDAEGSGALVSRTAQSTKPAWWLRIENGKLRFNVASCSAGDINCGVVPGTCADVGPCTEQSVWTKAVVNDGAWHQVRAVRDAAANRLLIELDGAPAGQIDYAAGGIVKNEQPLCVGAFADGARPFEGDIDGVRVELVD